MSVNTSFPDQSSWRPIEAQVAETISNANDRAVLAVLEDHGRAVSVPILAEAVAAFVTGRPTRPVTEAERQQYHLKLHHCTLPRLETLGLVARDVDRGTVELDDTSPLSSFGVDLADLGEYTSFEWEALSTMLAVPRRRTILAVLEDGREPSIDALAEAVAARERDVPRTRLPADAVQETKLALYHADLPKLAEVGLLADGWRDGRLELRQDRLGRVVDLLAGGVAETTPNE